MNNSININEFDLNNISICLTAVLKMLKDNCAASAVEYLKEQNFFTKSSAKSLKTTIKKIKNEVKYL